MIYIKSLHPRGRQAFNVTIRLSDSYMVAAFEGTDVFFEKRPFRLRECPVKETVAYISDCLVRRMAHVFSIEAVVAQFVHDDFICREIVCRIMRIHAEVDRAAAKEIVDAEKKGGFADLIAVRPVFEMTYRADCEYYLLRFYTFIRSYAVVAYAGYPTECGGDFFC